MVRGIHHVAISTGNLNRLVSFYKDLLGFQELLVTGWEAGSEVFDRVTGLRNSSARVAMLQGGDVFLEIFQYETPTPRPGDPRRPVCDHGITHIALEVTAIGNEYKRLKDAGMLFHCEPQSMSGRLITYGRDPDGNVVELVGEENNSD